MPMASPVRTPTRRRGSRPDRPSPRTSTNPSLRVAGLQEYATTPGWSAVHRIETGFGRGGAPEQRSSDEHGVRTRATALER